MIWRKKAPWLIICTLAALVSVSLPSALAAPASSRQVQAPTPFPTPTPDAAGQIIYQVQEGDTAWRIAAIAGISLQELYALNGLESTDFITPGMQLVLGTGGPTQPTAAPGLEPTATVIEASPTPEQGSGEICALLFEDANGNARLDEGETALPGGQISVVDALGQLMGEGPTIAEAAEADLVGLCFAELDQGDYNVSGAVPEGFNPTTSMNAPVRLNPGEVKYVEFGAQPGAAIGGGIEDNDGGTSMVLGLIGVLFLLAAGVLAYMAARYNRRSPRSLRS